MDLTDFVRHHHVEAVCPHESCLLSVLRGFRNGAIYGVKIRFPHALVMTFLFREGTFVDKMKEILKMTYTHSKNLACFVALYKALVCLLRHVRRKDTGVNALVAGAIGGAVMFGSFDAVTSQINMYLLSRIILGSVRTAIKHNYVPEYPHAFPVYAACCWALVMYLFHYQKGTLQQSLINSMTYLYLDSDKWPEDAGLLEWFMK